MATTLDQYGEIIGTIRQAAEDAGRGDAQFDIGFMPSWAHLTGGAADDLPPTQIIGAEPLAEEMRRARAAGVNTFHMKFRGRTFQEYLEQLDAFEEDVVPLVNEG